MALPVSTKHVKLNYFTIDYVNNILVARFPSLQRVLVIRCVGFGNLKAWPDAIS